MATARLDQEAIEAFAPDVKVGLLATVDGRGLPHVSLITSLCAKDERRLMFGQFTEGRSKKQLAANPRAGFLVMTLDRRLWRGRARYSGSARSGEDHQAFNARPMFRYNAYFGIHTVHYLDLLAVGPRESVPLAGMLAGTALAQPLRVLAERFGSGRGGPEVFNAWTRRHLAALTTLKFFCWLDPEGYPRLVPCVPCLPAAPDRLLFVPTVHPAELDGLSAGEPVAVFALNLETESVLVRGPFQGFSGRGPARLGLIRIDFVYNSMPPVPGQIYPPLPIPERT